MLDGARDGASITQSTRRRREHYVPLLPTILYHPRRLWVHLPQHYITAFYLCGKFSYHGDYILRYQRTMNCFQGNIYNVDEPSYPKFLELIQPFVSDLTPLERLSQGFPAPRLITHGPVIKPPHYQKPPTARKTSSSLSLHRSIPRILLQRVETQPPR